MDQGWKRFTLMVVFLLFWKNADGYLYSTNPTAVKRWGQPSDNAFLPLVVQSSMPEAPVTGVLLEEVVSSLPKNRPKFNLLQVVKGGVSSSSDSTHQALTPNTPSSASSLPTDQYDMSGLVSHQGSPGSITAHAASGSGQVVFAQGESGSISSQTGVSGQSTNDHSSPSLSSSASRDASYGAILQAQDASQFAQGSSSPYATISLPKYVSRLTTGPSSKPFVAIYGTQKGSSAPFTLQGSTYGGLLQAQDTSSPSTTVPSSKKQFTSIYSTQTGSFAPFTLQRLVQAQDATSKVVSGSLTPSVAVSLAQGVPSQSTVPSSKQITSVYSTQTGSSAPFTFQDSTTYGGLIQAQGTSQFVSGPSTPYVAVSLPKGVTSRLTTIPISEKTVSTIYGTQTGSSAPLVVQELLESQESTSKVVSSTPYVSVSLPQGVNSQSAVPSSKQITSVYSTQTGSSAPFTLQGLLQGQGSTSQVVSGSSTPYVAVSLPQVVTSQLTPVPSSKQVTSVYTTQTGSAPFTLQGLLQGQGSASKVASVSSMPYVAVSLPQGVTSQPAVPSSKQITSVYSTQTGSSAPFTLQGSTTYGGLIQTEDSASQVVSGSSTPYVAVSLPQVVTSQLTTVPSSKKPFTLVYGTPTGSSAPFTLQGLLQGQGSTSRVVSGSSYPYVAVSLPQGVTKQVTSVYNTQTGSSPTLNLQGLLQPQDATDQFSTGSSSSVLQTSTADASNPSSSFSTLRRYYTVKD